MKNQITKITQPVGMSDTAFKSMIARNGITPEKIEALRVSLERGKILIENSRKLLAPCPKLTWAQYKQMLNRANNYMELSTNPDWRNRWFLVQCRILQAMTNQVIFFR